MRWSVAPGICVTVGLHACVCLTCFICCLNTYLCVLLSYCWTVNIKKREKSRQGLNLFLLIPQNLPVNRRPTNWPLTFDLSSDWLTSSMWTAHCCLIHTASTCVLVYLWSILQIFVPPRLFVFSLHGWSNWLWVFRRDFKENTIILVSFLSSKCKKSRFSLPVTKATMTLFLYSNGAKNISIYPSV